MANSRRQTIHYTPRYTDDEAFEMLSPRTRQALRNSVTDWSAASVLRYERKHGTNKTLLWLRDVNLREAARPWITYRGRKENVPSTYVACGVPPLVGNWD